MKADEYQDTSNLLALKKDWEALLVNSAWVSLIEAVQAQTDRLQNEILFDPVRSAEDLYQVERKKGQLEGRLSITATATAMFEGLCQDLETAQNRKGEN